LEEEVEEKALPGLRHVRWTELPSEAVNPHLDRQFVVGAQTMVARMCLKKGCVIPLHSHHNEQISYIESGELLFTVDGKETVVRRGELICLAPHLPHMAVALEDTVNIDFFVPPRQDWINKSDEYLR
jgi:quercetin dioxygenase-like cupin family protein